MAFFRLCSLDAPSLAGLESLGDALLPRPRSRLALFPHPEHRGMSQRSNANRGAASGAASVAPAAPAAETGPLLRFAENNLAVRDGFASFFFHPWIDRGVLADLVRGLKKMGYAFADIRSMPLKVEADGIVHVTGSQEVALDPAGIGRGGIGFHGYTGDVAGNWIEQPASHGCVRMLQPHIDRVFHLAVEGTPVTIVR